MITLEMITAAVARAGNVSPKDLRGNRRHKRLADLRQLCYRLARQLTAHSTVQIGAYYGDRDHTTVMHGVKAVDRKLASDGDLASVNRRATRFAQYLGHLAAQASRPVEFYRHASAATFRTRRDKTLAARWGMAA